VDDFIRFNCPGCGKSVKARPEHAGRRVKCPAKACGQVTQVPVPMSLDSERDPETLSLDLEPISPQRTASVSSPPRAGRPPEDEIRPERNPVLPLVGVAVLCLLAAGAIAGWYLTRDGDPPADDGVAANSDPQAALPSAPVQPPAPTPEPKPEPKPSAPKTEAPPRIAPPSIQPPSRPLRDLPLLSNLKVASAETSPVEIRFAVTVEAGKHPIKFGKKAALWYRIGTPSTISDFGDYFAKEVQRLRPDSSDPNGVVYLGSMAGPGFVAGPCSSLQPAKGEVNVWTGVIRPGLRASGQTVEAGNSFGLTRYGLNEVPVSLLLWDDGYDVSRELKAVVDLKSGKLAGAMTEASPAPAAPAGTSGRAAEGMDGWKTFTSKSGGFTVAIPPDSSPDEKDRQVSIQLKGGKDSYQISWSEIDTDDLKKRTTDQILDRRRDQILQILRPPVKSELQSEKKITAGKHPGREFEIKKTGLDAGGIVITDSVTMFRGRAFVVGNRLYLLYTLGEPAFTSSKETTRILESLKFQ
jgi:hypothetical protein